MIYLLLHDWAVLLHNRVGSLGHLQGVSITNAAISTGMKCDVATSRSLESYTSLKNTASRQSLNAATYDNPINEANEEMQQYW